MTSINKKALTNLYEEPQLRATLFEPIAPFTYDLGSPEYKWGDIWVNRIVENQAPVEVYIPTATSGSGAPPATKALNNNLDFYLQFGSSTNFTVHKFITPTSSVQINPAEGSIFFSVTTNGLYFRNSTQWVRYLINQS